MDRIDVVLQRHGNDVVDVEITLDRLAAVLRTDQIRLIRLKAMQGKTIFKGKHRDRPQTQLGGGAHYADGDLASIGDQQLLHRPRIVWGCSRFASELR